MLNWSIIFVSRHYPVGDNIFIENRTAFAILSAVGTVHALVELRIELGKRAFSLPRNQSLNLKANSMQ